METIFKSERGEVWRNERGDYSTFMAGKGFIVDLAKEIERLRASLKEFQAIATEVVPGPDGQGREVLVTPQSLQQLINELQHEWDDAEIGLGATRSQLDAAVEEIERLRKIIADWENASQCGHPSPCTLGPLCPYCEIERLRAELQQCRKALRAMIERVKAVREAEIVSGHHDL